MENIQWATDYLLAHGYTITSAPEIIQTTPWSRLTCFHTSMGKIYLKQTPPALSLESRIIEILHDQFQASVPTVIATHPNLNCFLMTDSGKPLRDFLMNDFQPNLLSNAIHTYTSIQVATADHINVFLALGVPDWRLAKLPQLYAEFMENETFLLQDGMTAPEILMLQHLQSQYSDWCERLSRYAIPETLDHCDFHDNNILLDAHTQQITIIDWGETVITNPFFSLVSCLNQVTRRYPVKETDNIYIQLEEACLQQWRDYPEKNLRDAFQLTKKCWPIYAALGFYRLTLSVNAESFQSNAGRISGYLKKFIDSAK